mgnify:CR=1 FL=1
MHNSFILLPTLILFAFANICYFQYLGCFATRSHLLLGKSTDALSTLSLWLVPFGQVRLPTPVSVRLSSELIRVSPLPTFVVQGYLRKPTATPYTSSVPHLASAEGFEPSIYGVKVRCVFRFHHAPIYVGKDASHPRFQPTSPWLYLSLIHI